jgi:UDP-glucose 4-epimerase
VAVDDLSGGFARNLEPWINSGHSRFVLGDVQNRSFVSALFAEHGPFDYVYHLAAYAAEGLSHFVREFNYNNNLGASVLLLNHAVNQEERTGRAVARFVFTSSIAAFGAVEDPSELPMTEATPQRPEDPYGIAKHAFELDLRAAGRMFGLPFTIFRPHNVYGPRQNVADKFRNAVGIFMNQVLRAEPLSIFGDGRQTRCFSYVGDVAPIIAASVLYPATAGETLALALAEALALAWYWH